jgi:hypothetical protein
VLLTLKAVDPPEAILTTPSADLNNPRSTSVSKNSAGELAEPSTSFKNVLNPVPELYAKKSSPIVLMI